MKRRGFLHSLGLAVIAATLGVYTPERRDVVLKILPRALYWRGGVGNWSDAAMWALADGSPVDSAPGAIDSATINGGHVVLDKIATVGSLTVSGAPKLRPTFHSLRTYYHEPFPLSVITRPRE